MKSKKGKIVLLLGIFVISIIVYQYPIQKTLALRSFENYINKQGISTAEIADKKVIKDWKQGGYLIVLTLNDDPNNKYYYHYEAWTHKKGEALEFDRMTLDILDDKNSVIIDAPFDEKCKYPPIQE